MTTSAANTRPDWRNPVHLLAFGLGSGAAPKAPGTFGTLAAVPVYLALIQAPCWVYLPVVALMFGAGVWLCGRTAADLALEDPSGVVWDEWVGFLLTMWLAPEGWMWMLAGFCFFRLFDILKPWPISWVERRYQGGLGIMLDDVLAGVFAWLCLQGGVMVWS